MPDNKDPLVGFHYAIEIQGVVTGFFTECSGLGSEHEIIEHKVVDTKGKEITQYVPGRLKWDKVSLKRGITDNMDIWKWRKLVEDGKVNDARKSGSIVMLNQDLSEVARWNFERGWPSKVSGPSLKSSANEIGIEDLTIVHEGLERVK